MEETKEHQIKEHEYYVIRTIPSKEDKFIDALHKIVSKKEDHGIYAFFRPESVKGYIFAEAENLNKVVNAVRRVPNNKGVIRTQINPEELQKYLEKEGEQIIVNERDIVEIISGPFKGDKAKVVRLVPGKDEVVIEPLNVPVPIPITLSIDDIRVTSNEDMKNE